MSDNLVHLCHATSWVDAANDFSVGLGRPLCEVDDSVLVTRCKNIVTCSQCLSKQTTNLSHKKAVEQGTLF